LTFSILIRVLLASFFAVAVFPVAVAVVVCVSLLGEQALTIEFRTIAIAKASISNYRGGGEGGEVQFGGGESEPELRELP